MARTLSVGLIALGIIMTIGFLLARGGGDTAKADHLSAGDLLLDWATGDNTPTSVGVVDTACKRFSKGDTIQIDVVARNVGAFPNDWAAIDFVMNFPSPAVVEAPGPDDLGEGKAFDFATGGGAENFLFPDATDAAADYSVTETVPDGNSPHEMSLFDNGLVGNSGSGGLAHVTLGNTINLAAGVHELSLGVTPQRPGAVNGAAHGVVPVTFGSVQFAIDQDCPAGVPTATPGPGATATPTPTPGPGATPTPTPTPTPGPGALGDCTGGGGDPNIVDVLRLLRHVGDPTVSISCGNGDCTGGGGDPNIVDVLRLLRHVGDPTVSISC